MQANIFRGAGVIFAAAVFSILIGECARADTVAYYRFNEGAAGTAASAATGAILDSSSNGYNGTAINGPVYSSSVPANPIPLTGQSNPTSLSFDGTSQRIFIPNSDAGLTLTHSLTLEAYIYVMPLVAGSGDGNVIFRGDDSYSYDPYRLTVGLGGTGSTTIGFAVTALDIFTGEDIATLTAPIPDNTWIHVAGTLDDATGVMDLYVNGQLANSTTTTIRPFEILNGANPGIAIGALQNNGEYFHGLIDEVRISNAALTPNQFLDVPEPSAPVLAVVGLALLLLRRRRGELVGNLNLP